ncbi:synaptonemal complex protein 3-like [Talpa occidentalis]|uniref:synaptonemal complex protein 3-like n=1 Tax=Talpa occidentalis TaxID=50954 RepID=UPI0023F712AF|nr:synaptonemal complex protein 3-like [Talpa occidentalis]
MAPAGRKRKARSKKPQAPPDPMAVYDFESDDPEEPSGPQAVQPGSGDLCVPSTQLGMASVDKKCQARSGNSQAMAVCDFESEEGRDLSEAEAEQRGSSPAVDDDSWEEVHSTGTFAEDMRKELREMLEKFKEDIAKVHHEKRKSFQRNTDASIRAIYQKIEHIWKIQDEQRQKLFQEYSQQFLTLFQEWNIDVQKVKEEEEKLANLIQEQKNFFQQTRMLHHERQKKLNSLYEEFLKSMEDLDKDQEHLIMDENGELRQEMAALQNNIMIQSQEQDMAVVRNYLQSMLFW